MAPDPATSPAPPAGGADRVETLPVTVTHSVRKGVLETTPRSWTCTPEALEVTQHGHTSAVPYARIVRLRLRYEPGRFATNRCLAEVVTDTGWSAAIDNQHWAGVGQFEDRSLTYRLAIEALLARLRAANPQAVLETGQGAMLWLSTGFLLLMLALLFLVVLTIGGPVIAMAKLAILAFFVPTMVRYVRVNRRRVLPVSADPPEGVLPPLG